MAVVVHAHPRIHLGLLDTAGCSRRLFGGAGFSLTWRPVSFRARSSAQHRVVSQELSQEELRQLTKILERSGLPGTDLSIHAIPPRHVGMGTGTLLTLGVIASADYCAGRSLTPDEVGFLSGRGGASGVGWHSFWRGGFLIDAGQPNRGQALLPSGVSVPQERPPLAVRLEIPMHWRFSLLLPAEGSSISGTRERDFFTRNTPTSEQECLAAFPALYHGVVPAVACDDLSLLCDSLNEYQSLGLKRLEIARQLPATTALISALTQAGFPAGMSSLGPLVFAIHSARDSKLSALIKSIAHDHGAHILEDALPRNSGHSIVRTESE